MDIADPLRRATLDTGLNVAIGVSDGGEPRSPGATAPDTALIKVTDPQKQVCFLSNWNGSQSVWQAIAGGGNLSVR